MENKFKNLLISDITNIIISPIESISSIPPTSTNVEYFIFLLKLVFIDITPELRSLYNIFIILDIIIEQISKRATKI